MCSTREVDGFRFDVGASIIEDIDVIDRAFKRLGTSLDAQVDLIPLDPIYTTILSDGTKIKRPWNPLQKVTLEEPPHLILRYFS